MTKDNGNNGNAKKQPEPRTPLEGVQLQVVELQHRIGHLHKDIQTLQRAQGEHAAQFAAMFEMGMALIADAINKQVRNAIDVAAGQATEHLSALDKIAGAIPRSVVLVTDSASDTIVKAIRDLSCTIDAHAK